ncbi:hypothetical protein RJ641_034431 [Dillenia turbinata]|uniref:Uncharacterized protein n=1 Tax=Dillenia turbinata TaxID=194707 RepID=A0AAN8ZDN3_9MAGN
MCDFAGVDFIWEQDSRMARYIAALELENQFLLGWFVPSLSHRPNSKLIVSQLSHDILSTTIVLFFKQIHPLFNTPFSLFGGGG